MKKRGGSEKMKTSDSRQMLAVLRQHDNVNICDQKEMIAMCWDGLVDEKRGKRWRADVVWCEFRPMLVSAVTCDRVNICT